MLCLAPEITYFSLSAWCSGRCFTPDAYICGWEQDNTALLPTVIGAFIPSPGRYVTVFVSLKTGGGGGSGGGASIADGRPAVEERRRRA